MQFDFDVVEKEEQLQDIYETFVLDEIEDACGENSLEYV